MNEWMNAYQLDNALIRDPWHAPEGYGCQVPNAPGQWYPVKPVVRNLAAPAAAGAGKQRTMEPSTADKWGRKLERETHTQIEEKCKRSKPREIRGAVDKWVMLASFNGDWMSCARFHVLRLNSNQSADIVKNSMQFLRPAAFGRQLRTDDQSIQLPLRRVAIMGFAKKQQQEMWAEKVF